MNFKQVGLFWSLVLVSAVLAQAADHTIKAGSTDVTLYATVVRGNATPATGLEAGDFTVAYTRNRQARLSNELNNLSSATAAHNDWGLKHITFGVYRIDLPDAAFATGSPNVIIDITEAEGDPTYVTLYVDLVGYDPSAAAIAANVTQISGDSNAADNLEDAFDEESGSGVAMALESLSVINSGGSAVTLSSTGSNGSGLVISGHGTGEGIDIDAGAMGNGIEIDAESGNGIDVVVATAGTAFNLAGASTGHGLLATGGAFGNGARFAGGATTGSGLVAAATAPGSGGAEFSGAGTGFGLRAATSTGTGFLALATGSGGIGGKFQADGSGGGDGLQLIGGTSSTSGAAGDAIQLIGGANFSSGRGGHGLIATGGSSTSGTGGDGFNLNGTGAGAGLKAAGGDSGGNGIEAVGDDTGKDFVGGVDVDRWLGSDVETPTVNGVPEVDITHLLGVPVCD